MRILSHLSATALLTLAASGQAPILAYGFDAGGVGPAVNAGAAGGTMALNGLSLSGTSPNGTSCLHGDSSLASYGGDSGWITDLPNGVTVAFCVETSGHAMVGGNAFSYLWGDQTAAQFRCFTDGAAGANGILIRGGGLNDTLCPNAHGPRGWTHVTFVYDPSGESRVYVDGARVNTVSQPAGVAMTGTGSFRVGGYSGSIDAMDTDQFMEDFRVYDTVLTEAEINALAAGCVNQIYSVNSPAATLLVNGVSSSITAPGQVSAPTGATITAAMDTLLPGALWELAYSTAPTVPLGGGATALPGGSILNLNLNAPVNYLNGLFGTPWPGAPLTLQGTLLGGSYGGQFAATDPTSASGYAFSGAVDLDVAPCAGSGFDQGGGLPPGWTTPTGLSSWTVDSNGTPSVGTGPTSALSAPNYLYCETSGSGGTASFGVETCQINLAALPNKRLDFDLSRIGATIGTLTVSLHANGSLTTIATYSGPAAGQSQGGLEWSAESIDLTPFVPGNSPASVRFSYTAGGSYTGDVALDNVSFN